MLTPFNELAKSGIVPDSPDLSLEAGAWTDSRNVRYRDGAVEKVRGYSQALGDLSATAIWAAPITDGTNYFWMYGSNSVLYATDGSSHANVSHPSLSYVATDDLSWSGGAFHGYVLANDGSSVPQVWQPGLANKCTSLTAWPAISCKVMRPFKDFIFALRITDSGTYYPNVMRWSDRAAQSALPLSWDYSDPTNQAGINELGQTGDLLVDAVPLRDSLVIYKEFHTWIADYVGGQDIFSFRQIFSHVGMLTENCAITFGSNQLVLTDNDLVVHNGNDAQSIADKRTRRSLFNRINSARFKRSYMVADHRNREAWICFPESGYDWPTLALVWNWSENTFDYRELGGPKTFATTGIIPGTAVSFDTDSGTFDDATGTFDEETYNPFLTRVLLLDSAVKKAYQNDTGEDFNGIPMSVYAERTGMTITKDLTSIKRVKRIFPKVIGTAGDTLRFYIGSRMTVGASTSWSGPYTFTIGSDYKIDFRVAARILDLRIEYSGTNTFRLFGMDVEHEFDGYR
jgi:hypothetical protein